VVVEVGDQQALLGVVVEVVVVLAVAPSIKERAADSNSNDGSIDDEDVRAIVTIDDVDDDDEGDKDVFKSEEE
jgi:hypothetical protein